MTIPLPTGAKLSWRHHTPAKHFIVVQPGVKTGENWAWKQPSIKGSLEGWRSKPSFSIIGQIKYKEGKWVAQCHPPGQSLNLDRSLTLHGGSPHCATLWASWPLFCALSSLLWQRNGRWKRKWKECALSPAVSKEEARHIKWVWEGSCKMFMNH